MAKRYSDLINDLWSGNSKSITPLKFRVSLSLQVSIETDDDHSLNV